MPPVNILPQQRSKLTHIPELATTIRANGGLINPINLICFESQKDAESYARFFRKMYGDRRKVELKADADGKYYFLVAGHRRFAAIGQISVLDVPNVSIGLLIPITAPKNISLQEIALKAAFFQAAENIQHPPDPIDKAHSIVAMRNAMRAARGGKKVTVSEVVRESGQSEGAVSDALRFYGLPEAIRRKAVNGKLTYGRALLLARLFYASFKGKKLVSRAELDFMVRSTITQGTSEELLLKRVNEIIRLRREEMMGQDLFSGGTGLENIISVEARSASQIQAKIWISNVAILRAYIANVRKEPKLLNSELAGMYGKDPLRSLVLGNAELLMELASMLHAHNQITDIDVARVKRAVNAVK